jgi:hypothetical protein
MRGEAMVVGTLLLHFCAGIFRAEGMEQAFKVCDQYLRRLPNQYSLLYCRHKRALPLAWNLAAQKAPDQPFER